MKRIVFWIPELIVVILAVVCQNCSVLRFLPFLLVIAAAKGFWLSRSGFDEALCSRQYLFLPAASLLLELGSLLRVFAGASTEWGLLLDAAVCLASIAAGYGVLRLLEKHGNRCVKHSGILYPDGMKDNYLYIPQYFPTIQEQTRTVLFGEDT